MRLLLRRSPLVWVLIAVLTGGGCGASNPGTTTTRESVTLDEVSGILKAAGADAGGPKKPEDLAKFESIYPLGYAAISSGEVVVVWGAPPLGEGEANAPDVVLAYEKKVPTEGGHVLMTNGRVRTLTADEFKAAPKAGKK